MSQGPQRSEGHPRSLIVSSPPPLLLPAPRPITIQSRTLVIGQARAPSSSLVLPGGCVVLVLLILLLGGYVLWSAMTPPLVSKAHTTSRAQEKTIPTVSTSSKITSPPLTVHPVQRISQADPAQYNSVYSVGAWWPSTCSTAAMTMIMNAYGNHYRLVDILAKQVSLGAITVNEGLLSYQGLSQVATAFGFVATWLSHPTPQEVIAYAQLGNPLIVNLRGAPDWPTGHFVVVTGGDAHAATIVDSSNLALTRMSISYLQSYWTGGAALFLPRGTSVRTPYQVTGSPTVSAAFINKVLTSYGSPATGKGQALYDLGVKYGIDPVFALAFFQHESTFGTRGEAAKTMSIGNLRCISRRPCVDQSIGGGYAQMNSWEDGFEIWYQLIRTLYVTNWGANTVDLIIPHYAPDSDNNDEAAYIASVETSVFTWRSGSVRV